MPPSTDLLQGTLDVLILKTLALEPMHGWGIALRIQQVSKDALQIGHRVGANGIDAAIAQFNLDAVVSATDNPAWATDLIYGDHFLFGTSSLAASPGYPIVQVPAARSCEIVR